MPLSFKNTPLYSLFYPKSIVVVGASRDSSKVGGIVLNNILYSEFFGDLYLVNSSVNEIQGVACYKTVLDLPKTPDLAIIAVSVNSILQVFTDIINKNIKNVVIFTAGFKESGAEGLQLEQKILSLAKQNNINVLGPNCLGFVNNFNNLNATFSNCFNKTGSINFISQSGAIASSFFDYCKKYDLGFNFAITLGNKALINESDILQFFEQMLLKNSLAKNCIAMYLESITEGTKFFNLLKSICVQTPVFILKPGKHLESQKAMQSHTGSLAGESKVFEAAVKQAGAFLCNDLNDLFDLSLIFNHCPNILGNNVAVVSNAGGPGVIVSDLIKDFNLNLAKLSSVTKKTLMSNLPTSASVQNPVDILGDALSDRYKNAVEAVLQDKNVDVVLVLLTPQTMTQPYKTAQVLVQLKKRYKKPIICSFMGGLLVDEAKLFLIKNNICCFDYSLNAVKAISTVYKFNLNSKQKIKNNSQLLTLNFKNNIYSNALKIINNVYLNKQKNLDSFEAHDLLKTYKINVPKVENILSFTQAKAFANKHNYPVVLKLSSSNLLHKTEFNAVKTNIQNDTELKFFYKDFLLKIPVVEKQVKSKVQILIQNQIANGLELIIGVKKDSVFNNVLMLGLGGTLAELIEDVNLFILPFDCASQLDALLNNSKLGKLLSGYRNGTKYDVEDLKSTILNLSQLALDFENIDQIEINPLIVNKNGAFAVDGKVLLK